MTSILFFVGADFFHSANFRVYLTPSRNVKNPLLQNHLFNTKFQC